MVLVYTIAELQKLLSALKVESKSLGFVPTMGALHRGHLSLVEESIRQNDITVASLFVNPTQFNDRTDFEKYPRNIGKDINLLEETGIDVVFIPSEKEIYPEPDARQFSFSPLDMVMEGKHRPGHFNGVAQVVSRLFDLVKPSRAYFGQKDFQQLAIIRMMVKQLNLPVEIIGMPIIREENGLAMSSRNERLTAEQRKTASSIYKTLAESRSNYQCFSVGETIEQVVIDVNKQPGLHIEYFEIVDGNTLQSISDWKDTDYAVGCIAVFCGDVRLIDNITYYSQF